MINLLTGTPGAGKTCYLIDFIKAAARESRPIFVHGVPDLRISHQKVFCRSAACTVCEDRPAEGSPVEVLYADQWHEWAPSGAMLVFDEVQHVYRPRPQGKEPPESVKAFETHRHRGLDFWLVSQNPTIFDSNVRKMVSRHIHLVANWAGRHQYEWPECQSNVQNHAGAVKSSYSLNKDNFGLYRSAELHTKQKRKLPVQVYVAVGALLFTGFMGYRAYSSISDRLAPAETTVEEAVAPERQGASLPPGAVASRGQTSDEQPSTDRWNYNPTIPGIPETAPAFFHLPEVQDFPRLAGCIHSPARNSCNCYTHQGTRYRTSRERCMNYIHEREFRPW